MEKKNAHGGARAGSGRKASGIRTVRVMMRLPEQDLAALKDLKIKNRNRFYVEAAQAKIAQLKDRPYHFTGKAGSVLIAQKSDPKRRVIEGDRFVAVDDMNKAESGYIIETDKGVFPSHLFYSFDPRFFEGKLTYCTKKDVRAYLKWACEDYDNQESLHVYLHNYCIESLEKYWFSFQFATGKSVSTNLIDCEWDLYSLLVYDDLFETSYEATKSKTSDRPPAPKTPCS